MPTKTRIVWIGNSRGIRIPKTLLDQAELPEDVELYEEPGRLVIQAARHPRSGWAEAARDMRASGDDQLLDEPTRTRFDEELWNGDSANGRQPRADLPRSPRFNLGSEIKKRDLASSCRQMNSTLTCVQ